MRSTNACGVLSSPLATTPAAGIRSQPQSIPEGNRVLLHTFQVCTIDVSVQLDIAQREFADDYK